MSVEPVNRQYFIGRLESVRGIAAFCVAICHSMIWMPIFDDPVAGRAIWEVHGLQAIATRLLISIVNGSAAVDIFFVLSGFVLARSLARRSISLIDWVRFVVKRAFRIFPPYLVWLVPISAYLLWREQVGPAHALFDWVDRWKLPFAWSDAIQNASLVSTAMNPPAWTLKVEMLVGILFPGLMFVFHRNRPAVIASLILALAVVGNALATTSGERPWFYFIFLFAIGIAAEKFGAEITRRIHGKSATLFAALSLAMIVAPGFVTLLHRIGGDMLIGLGAALLICILASEQTCYGAGWLDSALTRFLGRISYSFYLTHYLILYLTTLLVQQWTGLDAVKRWPLPIMALTAVISVAIAAPLAWVLFRVIEKPFTLLGRRIVSDSPSRAPATSPQ
jgi:peptidoglycan/LPS O-acetylase OafA/YrhL